MMPLLKIQFSTLIICTMLGAWPLFAQQTLIPDPNFEQALISLGLDDVLDGMVLTANIDSVTNLEVDAQGITDLTGIEDFSSLEVLHCSVNELNGLDVSQNSQLRELRCFSNDLTELNVASNVLLEELNFRANQVSGIDLTNNVALYELWASENVLTSLDLTQNLELLRLFVQANLLEELNLSQNKILDWLNCGSNQLEELDLTANSNLRALSCGGNSLTTLDLSQNQMLLGVDCQDNEIVDLNLTNITSLGEINCSFNKIKELDVSANLELALLFCSNNELTCLNVRNGNNINFHDPFGFYNGFNALDNPNLFCIEVDDPNWSILNWEYKDPQAEFSIFCNNPCSTLGIDETYSKMFSVYPNPTKDKIYLSFPDLSGPLTGKLLDTQGRTLKLFSEDLSQVEYVFLEQPSGLYFFELIDLQERHYVIRIIKN